MTGPVPDVAGSGASGPVAGVREVVLATRNDHKVGELNEILAETCRRLGVVVVGLAADAPEVIEDGLTFADNALLKARSAAAFTGLPALADDSGLAVDVMHGAPGIFSARWSGGRGDRANYELLLQQVADVRDEHRGAGFVCAAALVLPDGREALEIGEFRGTLAREPRGTGGFGYDPIFVPDGQGGQHLAELSAEQKNAISHRHLAFTALAPRLEHLLGA